MDAIPRGKSHYVPTNVDGCDTYSIFYDTALIDAVAIEITSKKYDGDLATCAVYQAIGISKTTFDRMDISKDDAVKMFEGMGLSADQIRCHVIVVLYNSVRSSIGTRKSTDQKNRLKAIFGSYSNVIAEVKEVKSHLTPRPDGIIKLTSDIHKSAYVYLRTGTAAGGSQNDRFNGMIDKVKANPSIKFVCIFDGPEAEQETTDVLSKCPNCYSCSTNDIDESKIVALIR